MKEVIVLKRTTIKMLFYYDLKKIQRTNWWLPEGRVSELPVKKVKENER